MKFGYHQFTHVTPVTQKPYESSISLFQFVVKSVNFDSKVYSLDVIKKAAYRFSDSYSFEFEIIKNKIVCKIKEIKKNPELSFDEFVDIFKNHVLDYDLRGKIFKETSDVRNLILSHTFSKTKLQDG